jgi:hypothetical protein
MYHIKTLPASADLVDSESVMFGDGIAGVRGTGSRDQPRPIIATGEYLGA